MFKRIGLFLAVNFLVSATIVMNTYFLGLDSYLAKQGVSLLALAGLSSLWGGVGALVALFCSEAIATFAGEVKIIDLLRATPNQQYLIDTVHQLAKNAGLDSPPTIGIYQSPELNAFVTGSSQNRSLLAVSSGLLHNMDREQSMAVIAHEIAFIANGSMVTIVLLQGILSAFTFFLAQIVIYIIERIRLFRGLQVTQDISALTYGLFTLVFVILFTLWGSLVVATYSRWLRYQTDKNAAQKVGYEKVEAALRQLNNAITLEDDRAASLTILKVSQRPSWLGIFSTHPALEKRLQFLRT